MNRTAEKKRYRKGSLIGMMGVVVKMDEEIFGNVISAYTDADAVEDGMLVDISQFSTIVTLATSNLLESKKYIDGDKLNVPCIMDLVSQCIHGLRKGRDLILVEFPDGVKGRVRVLENMSGKYTVMLPGDY